MKIDAIMIKAQDNVANALRDLTSAETVTVGMGDDLKQVNVSENIPFGHKFAVVDIAQGEHIIKYGEVIGRATRPIAQGAHAHIQNIESLRGRGDLQ